MSEHSIKCSSYDGLLLYETRERLIGMTRYGHLHMTVTPAASLCKVETATRLLNFFSSPLPECL